MLLNEMLKMTNRFHKDYADITQALKSIEAVCAEVNKHLQDFERRYKLIKLQDELTKLPASLELVTQGRVLLVEKDIHLVQQYKRDTTTPYQLEPCQLVLLSDMIMLIKRGTKRATYMNHVITNKEPLCWISLLSDKPSMFVMFLIAFRH